MSIIRFVISMFMPVILLPTVFAQDYPSKPIRIVTTGAGSGSDFVARILSQGMAGPLGQPVIVDNKTPSVFATETASKASSDGYTFIVTGGALWIYPLLNQAPYDATGSFSPISLVTREVFVVAVNPSVPVTSIGELIASAKARPGEITYGAAGVGSSGHLAAELFKSLAGVNMLWVPYKAMPQAITGLIGGEIHVIFFNAGLLMPQVKAGKLKALAVTSSTPSVLVPGLPTLASVLPGYEAIGSTGIWAPAKTPETIINRIHQEVVRVLNQSAVKEKILASGAEPVGNTPAQFAAYIKSDLARVSKLIKDAGIKVQ